MYKRRKKVLQPQASSTILGSQISSQLSSTSIDSNNLSTLSKSPSKTIDESSSLLSSFETTKSLGVINKENSTVKLTPKKKLSSQPKKIVKDNDIKRVTEMLESPKRASPKRIGQPLPPPSPLRYEMRNNINLNFMEDIIEKSGCLLTDDSNPNILKRDQAVFVRDVTKALSLNKDLKKSVDMFMSYLEKYLSNRTVFKMALSPTKTDCDYTIARLDFQDCLIRLLLLVDPLQEKLIEYLLDRLGEFIVPDDRDDEGIMWVRMILQPLRYLTKLCNSSVITKKLFDVIHSSPVAVLQHEIINCIPDIISDEQRDEISKEFLELMKNESTLTASILIALSNICLEGENLYDLQINLLKTLRRAPLDQIAPCVRFIISAPLTSHIDEIFNGLRSELTICHPEDPLSSQVPHRKGDLNSIITIIFEKIRDTILINKKLGEAWQKNISKVKSYKYHKPIDLLLLLILHSTTSDNVKKKFVENLIKSKIRSNHFRTSLIEDTLSTCLVVINSYFKDLLKLISLLLVSNDVIVSKFAFSFYVECFKRSETYYQKLIIFNVFENVQKNIKNAREPLNLLHYITENYPNEMSTFSTRMLLLLDLVSELKVVEVRQLVDALCLIAFNDHEDPLSRSGFQDELFMIAQKQLCCPDQNIIRSGIVSALTIMKHMVNVKQDEENESAVSEEEPILSSQCEKAFNLLELVLIGTQSVPEAYVLTYDQLSHAIMNCPNMNKIFLQKVSLLMQGTLQTHYIIASSTFKKSDDALETSLQFCLDEELADPIALNIIGAIIAENKKKQTVPVVQRTVALPGLVRVVRSLELADLSEIDALLGCPVIFPDNSIYSKFSSADPHIQKIALDCLFHTCNWFRETVNSFVYFIKEGKPDKILMRMRAILHLQNLIGNCLPYAISYSPPNYYTDSGKTISMDKPVKRAPARKRKKGKKNDKDKEGDNDSSVSETLDSEEEDECESIVNVEFLKLKPYLRELDFDVFLILTVPLTITPQPPNGYQYSAEFGPSELMLLLEDLNSKLKFCLEPKRPLFLKQDPIGFDNLSNIPLDLIVRNTTKLTNHIAGHLQKIVEHLHNLIKINDGILDAPGMFASGIAELKKCTALIFSIYTIYFNWPELKTDTYIKCLLKTAMKLGGQTIEKGQPVSLNFTLQSAIDYLKTISTCILDLTSAVNLINFIATLLNLQEDSEEDRINVNVGSICEEFLKRKWYDFKGVEAKGSTVNQQQSKLLETYFTEGNLDNITNTLTWLTQEITELDNDSCLLTFPHFNKNNLNVLISSICKSLAIMIKKGLEDKNDGEQLKIWDRAINALQDLVIIIKSQDSKFNLRQFLRGCLPILTLFLSHGMKVCSVMFKLEMLTVSQTIKKLQIVTRYIQNICNYSKISKDNTLIQQLPGIRGILETIVLSVKNMILQNKCTDAFFMGSVKNKDHHGEIISTQESVAVDSTVDEEEPEEMEIETSSNSEYCGSQMTTSQVC